MKVAKAILVFAVLLGTIASGVSWRRRRPARSAARSATRAGARCPA